MRGRAGIVFVVTVLLAVLAVYGYWLEANFETREREVVTGVSEKARRNPLLAAERFLNAIGREVVSVSGRDRLLEPPAPGDVLLVNRFSANLPVEREEALVEWMSRGGHLILAPGRPWDEETETGGSRFLEGFGIRLEEGAACGCPEDESAAADADELELEEWESPEEGSELADEAGAEEEQEGIVATLPGREEALAVSFDADLILRDIDEISDWRIGEEGATHLLQIWLGEGRLTVLSDIGFLHNEQIGELDHAAFLASLVEGGGKIWLLYSSNMPSLLSLLWDNQPYILVSLCLAVVLWVWWLTGFTGARRMLSGTPRRNLLEHLDAAAAYAWRVDRARQMSAASRQAVFRAWVQKHPRLQQLERKPRCAWIAEHSGLPQETVESALYGEPRNEEDLIHITAAQQKLLAALT